MQEIIKITTAKEEALYDITHNVQEIIKKSADRQTIILVFLFLSSIILDNYLVYLINTIVTWTDIIGFYAFNTFLLTKLSIFSKTFYIKIKYALNIRNN